MNATKDVDIIAASKVYYSVKVNGDGNWPGKDMMQVACLQRIATAAEAMAENTVNLQKQIDYLTEQRNIWRCRAEALKKERRSLRGQITKLKNKLV
ncbi:MAG: hypothetical protein SFU21_03420 [Flavihumibacter sp.]|nr:hypothetical protein [Flavihumibacter sp.]